MARARSLSIVHLADDRLTRGPWVYARHVQPPEDPPLPGDVVEVHDASERFVGHALYNPASDIRLRWLSRGRRSDLDRPRQFLFARLKAADDLRRRVLRLERDTDAYRVVHAEGDDLPGLIVDRLGSVLVCEHHALGFWHLRAEVSAALGQLYPGFEVLHRVPERVQKAEGFPDSVRAEVAAEEPPERELLVHEHGLGYPVAPACGHKTGFFCDQRENRRRVAQLAAGRTVLDLCCNLGGFALGAMRAGARGALAVDLDEVVLERARRAAELNGLAVDFVHQDAFNTLRGLASAGERFDLVVLDPPKLAAGRTQLDQALRAYGDLNTLAVDRVRPGGLLATFSCSGALDLAGFLGTVFASARRAERGLKLLEVLGPGPDHPQRPDHPRSRYLKGALAAVD